jgi:hypothetical protein
MKLSNDQRTRAIAQMVEVLIRDKWIPNFDRHDLTLLCEDMLDEIERSGALDEDVLIRRMYVEHRDYCADNHHPNHDEDDDRVCFLGWIDETLNERDNVCYACRGSGHAHDSLTESCMACGGTGKKGA